MKIVDLYSEVQKALGPRPPSAQALHDALSASQAGRLLLKIAKGWDIELSETAEWMSGDSYSSRRKLAEHFLERAPEVVDHVERLFGAELVGEVWLAPSLQWFDGFARYDSGEHRVIFGLDHPDADESYLRALMAHELSHVYRDHQPDVWSHLGKPLKEVKRDEYLEAATAREHLVSEGLATLFSQLAYPDVPLHVHHYYNAEEMSWCVANHARVEDALLSCLRGSEDVWSFYGEGRAGEGSPSRTQYYWAAHVLKAWLESLSPGNYARTLVEAHGWVAERFTCFEARA